MRLNADFTQRIVIRPGDTPWQASPSPGVTRRMLDRVGDEAARATSLVRYAPGSVFPAHEHPDGEEILVLEGVFTDEHGEHGPGTYLRNPDGSRHAPRGSSSPATANPYALIPMPPTGARAWCPDCG